MEGAEARAALAERILQDVQSALRRNPDLSTFDIVPADSNQRNKSPVLHLENCLGLESWCVKHVYTFAYSQLTDRIANPKRRTNRITSVDGETLVKQMNVTLLINPDVSTLWNRRREMVQRGFLCVKDELSFTKLVLSRKAKSNDSFAYRRWIWDILLKDNASLSGEDLNNLVSDELRVCEAASNKCPNNYHSWTHRTWLLKQLQASHINMQMLHIDEYTFSERWTAKHVSDYSCFHYRQFCIENVFTLGSDSLFKELEKRINANLNENLMKVVLANIPKHTREYQENRCDEYLINLLLGKAAMSCKCEPKYFDVCRKIEILFYELTLNEEMIRFYKLHETLWYHRRYVIHEILSLIYEYCGVTRKNVKVKYACRDCLNEDILGKDAKQIRYDSDCVFSCNLYIVLANHDRNFTDERRTNGDHYADRHEKYLKFIEGVK